MVWRRRRRQNDGVKAIQWIKSISIWMAAAGAHPLIISPKCQCRHFQSHLTFCSATATNSTKITFPSFSSSSTSWPPSPYVLRRRSAQHFISFFAVWCWCCWCLCDCHLQSPSPSTIMLTRAVFLSLRQSFSAQIHSSSCDYSSVICVFVYRQRGDVCHVFSMAPFQYVNGVGICVGGASAATQDATHFYKRIEFTIQWSFLCLPKTFRLSHYLT